MLYFLLFACLVGATVAEKTIPLFIIDAENATRHIAIPPPNPFIRLSEQGLNEIVQKIMALRGTIVVFAENQFCVEYVSGKDDTGTPYSYLHEALLQGKVKYIPAVLQPFPTLNDLLPVGPRNEFHLSYDGTSNKELFTRDVQRSTYYYIYFKDRLNNTLTRSLREHDLLMYEVYFSMKNVARPPLVAFYTGMTNPVSYKQSRRPIARQGSKKSTEGGLIFHGHRSLFVMFGVFYRGVATDPKEDRVISDPPAVHGKVNVSLSVQHNIKLNLIFHVTKRMWKLSFIELIDGYEDVLLGISQIGIKVPWGYSYLCGSAPIRIYSRVDKSLLIIQKFQMQLFNDASVTTVTPLEPEPGDDLMTFPPAVQDTEPPGGMETEPPGGMETGKLPDSQDTTTKTDDTMRRFKRQGDEGSSPTEGVPLPETSAPVTDPADTTTKSATDVFTEATDSMTPPPSDDQNDLPGPPTTASYTTDNDEEPIPEAKLATSKFTSTLTFGPTINCNKFISIAILEGLSVVLVFMSGLVLGVSFLFRVQANSRFDDPRGARINFAED